MKKIIFVLSFLAFISAKSQVKYTMTEPKKMEAESFVPITVYTKSDSIVRVYGFLNGINYSSNAVRFLKTKPKTPIVNKADWSSYYAENLKKVEVEHESKKLTLDAVKSKEGFGSTFFYYKIYENTSATLYCFPYNIPYINKKKCVYTVLKKGDEKSTQALLKLSDKPKVMPSKITKFFKDCPELQQKIEAGEYQKSLEGLISTLDFYDANCKKN